MRGSDARGEKVNRAARSAALRWSAKEIESLPHTVNAGAHVCYLLKAAIRDLPLHLRQRVAGLDQGAQSLFKNVGIDLRRRDIGVAQHLLKCPQICAVRQQV